MFNKPVWGENCSSVALILMFANFVDVNVYIAADFKVLTWLYSFSLSLCLYIHKFHTFIIFFPSLKVLLTFLARQIHSPQITKISFSESCYFSFTYIG